MTPFLALAAACFVLAGCRESSAGPETATGDGRPSLPSEERLPQDAEGNFTLYVSNQSFEIADVDIRIEVDGALAVEDTFAVEDQHNWIEFVFDLPEGKHVIEASSKRGDATLVRRFQVTAEHWAVVNYWYYPGEKKRFTFMISDTAIGFA